MTFPEMRECVNGIRPLAREKMNGSPLLCGGSTKMPNPLNLDSLELLDRDDLEKLVRAMATGGVFLNFHGKRSAMEIAKRVRPRVTRRMADLHCGTPEEQCRNMIVEGENLQAMVTLYKFRGQVDLIVTDPPYNTGQQFRYNDRWDEDPNDPELGTLVTKEDGSRHTKWMKAILPRLHMMKSMLKPQGVIAMCIDDNELFHLGVVMDEVFGEDNRIGILNWQKTYAPKQTTHLSTATEYILIYAKDLKLARTGLLPRDEEMNARFTNRDNDPEGNWRPGDATAKESRTRTMYGIQSPFTGILHYPETEYSYSGTASVPTRHWSGITHAEMKALLEEWGTPYEWKDIGDDRGKALIIKGAHTQFEGYDPANDPAVKKASVKAAEKLKHGAWPRFFFSEDKAGTPGFGRPAVKRYLNRVLKGRIPWTYWADEEYETPFELGSQSWDHEESGHSQSGLNELDAVIGKGHGFATVKPLKLFKKIIQIWCPPNGLVLDPYAGSGTTGHAVLGLNKDTRANRRFILIEQGRPDKGDTFARSLTAERLKRAITGEWANGKGTPLPGGFEFRALTKQIDAKTVLSMRKDELIDVVITSHWESNSRNSPTLIRVEDNAYKYLVGKNHKNEGYFLIWNGGNAVGQLDVDNYNVVLQEGRKAGLKPPYHVYARYEVYQSQNVIFYKIPDRILAHLGLNESSDRYNEED
jgi:adenine-specific DNA-methyltransferase